MRVQGVLASPWLASELDVLQRERPRVFTGLRWLWRHPAAVLLPLAAVVLGAMGAAVPHSDAEWFRTAGSAMWGPGFLDTFSTAGLQMGPLYLGALGALDRVVVGIGLPELASVAAVESVAVLGLALWVAQRVASAAGAPRLPVQWATGLVLVLGGYLAEAIGNGHPEEILLGLMLVAVALAADVRRWRLAGVLLGLAVGVKQWAIIGAGVVARGRKIRGVLIVAATATAVVALEYGPFFLGGSVRTYNFDWGVAPHSLMAALHGWTGLSGWGLRLLQGAVAALAGLLVAWRARSSLVVPVAVAIAVRLWIDPLRLSYYDGPLVVLLVIWLWTSAAPRLRRYAVLLTAATPLGVLTSYLVPSELSWLLGTVVLPLIVVLLLVFDTANPTDGEPAERAPGRRRRALERQLPAAARTPADDAPALSPGGPAGAR